MHWLSQRKPIRGTNCVDTLMWVSLSCVTEQCAIGPEAMWHGEWREPSCSGRPALFEDRYGNYDSYDIRPYVSRLCDVSPSVQWGFVCTAFVIHVSSWSASLLSLKCHFSFSLNCVRNWAQWHIIAPRLCSPVARTVLAGFLEMCLKCCWSIMLQQ